MLKNSYKVQLKASDSANTPVIVLSQLLKHKEIQEDFSVLKQKSDTNILLRYLPTGRIGYTKVHLTQQEDVLLMEVYEALLGFGVPIILAIASLWFYFENEKQLALFFFLCGVGILLLICSSFYSNSTQIKESILKALIEQQLY
jgi:hypothetical protein